MNDDVNKHWRARLNERRTEERTIKLIERLHRALVLTKHDAERAIGHPYGDQSVCAKALREYERWDQQRQKPP